MTTYMTLELFLRELRRSSKHGMDYSVYASPHIAAYEVKNHWPKSEELLSFYVSDYDIMKDRIHSVVAPYFEKAMKHEEIMSSPLMKALR